VCLSVCVCCVCVCVTHVYSFPSPITKGGGDWQEYGCDARGRDAISNCYIRNITSCFVSHY